MAIEAISALQAKPVQGFASAQSPASDGAIQTSKTPQADLTLRVSAQAPQEGPVADQVANRIYDTIDRLGVELPEFKPGADSVVYRAKASMSPENDVIAAGPKAVSTGEHGLEMISKAFDHAVFMASVNQVLSGVSDTARTLVRQQ